MKSEEKFLKNSKTHIILTEEYTKAIILKNIIKYYKRS